MAPGVLRRSTAIRFSALAAATVLLVACSSSASPSASGAAPATPQATTAGTPTEAPSSGAFPSFDLSSFKADVALESLLPDSLGGAALTKLSFSGSQFMTSGSTDTQQLQALLTALGKTPADVSLAIAAGTDMTLIAYRIKGVDANSFLSAFLQIAGSDVGTTTTDVTISGKSVKKEVPSSGDTTYIYPSGDVIFIVTGTGQTDALVSEAFSKLR